MESEVAWGKKKWRGGDIGKQRDETRKGETAFLKIVNSIGFV